MADHRENNDEVGIGGWDEASDCQYFVTISRSEDHTAVQNDVVHEVSIVVDYRFSVTPDNRHPIADTNPIGGRWCLHGLSELREEIVGALDRARIPVAARNDTVLLIFEEFITEKRLGSNARYVVGVNLKTETRFDFTPGQPMQYEHDDVDRFGNVLAVMSSMERGCSREIPARRDAVEALERVRVCGGERETSCVVCLEEFSFGIEAIKMPCSHVFHRDCLVRWLRSRYFCPLCRFELPYIDDKEDAMEEDSDPGIRLFFSSRVWRSSCTHR